MKSIGFYASSNRSDNLLHIETDGAVINVHVGLTDSEGRAVTSVQIIPDDEHRGGDGEGRMWHVAEDSGPANTRLIRDNEKETP